MFEPRQERGPKREGYLGLRAGLLNARFLVGVLHERRYVPVAALGRRAQARATYRPASHALSSSITVVGVGSTPYSSAKYAAT